MKRRALALLAALAATLVAYGQNVKYEKYTLPNGMTVILHEDHSLPVATVNIWYHVGSKDEPPRRSGFAHLFEHLMFMGTKRAPTGMYDKIMESGGGYNNASTTQDRTNYYDYGPSNLLPTLLWLEADRLEDLGKMMDQHKLNLQREVVKNERRENYENAPYGLVPLKINEALYPEGHPYHVDTIGLPEDLDAATVKDVKDFFATFYVPNNASMVVAGDFDPAVVKPLIASLFGTLPRRNDPIHKTATEPELHEVKRLTMADSVPQARTYMVWHSPAYYKPGDGEMDLISEVLAGGIASRLYQRLIVEDRLASDVSATQQSGYLGSLFYVTATAKEGIALDTLEAAIDDEIRKLLKSGPSAAELDRAKAKYRFASLSGLQDLADVADRMNQYDFYLGEPNSFQWDLERHTKPSPQAVRDWGQKVLDLNGRLILRVLPENPVPEKNPRDSQPKSLAMKTFQLPNPEQFTLSNGLKVFYFNRPEFPLMSVSMLFDGGAASDPSSKSGLAYLTADMLSQGAGDLDAQGFSQALDALGASFGAGSGEVSTTVNMSTTADSFPKALGLYADAILRPRLESKDFEREQSLHLEGLAQDEEDPETIARLVAMREFFGDANPYGRNTAGTQDSIKSIRIDDVKREHGALYRPEKATLFVSGSLSKDEVQRLLDGAFGNWKPSETPSLVAPKFPLSSRKGLRVVVVEKPEAVQTVIRFVFPGVPYANPNRIALEGLSMLLGGTFTSRLNSDLREAKGYTYGAGTSAIFEPVLGYMVAQSAVRADVTGNSLQEFLSQFTKLRTGDVSDLEAGKARSSMRTETISSLETLGGLIGTAETLYINGRTMKDLSADLDRLSKLTAAGINPLAKQAVPLDSAVLVLVGDKNLILKQLAGIKGLPKPEIVKGPH